MDILPLIPATLDRLEHRRTSAAPRILARFLTRQAGRIVMNRLAHGLEQDGVSGERVMIDHEDVPERVGAHAELRPRPVSAGN